MGQQTDRLIPVYPKNIYILQRGGGISMEFEFSRDKTLKEKDKMQVTRFSFSQNVFKSYLPWGPLSSRLCGKGLIEVNPFPKQALVFTCLHYKSFENTGEKEKLLLKSNFSFSPKCFLPLWRTFRHDNIPSVFFKEIQKRHSTKKLRQVCILGI